MGKLALYGGKPLREASWPSWPVHDGTECRALSRVYARGVYRVGEESAAFARQFADFCGARYCIPVANGTVSLELIFRALGIGRGDEIILPPYTFIASYSAIRFVGATPVFADISPIDYNLDPDAVECAVTPRTRAILAVSVGGRPVDYDALSAVAEKHGIALVGDAAQAVGASFRGTDVASLGTAASISCQNSKNLTCGEGGIITTNDQSLYEAVTAMLSGGDDTHLALDSGITEFGAAILSAQLARLPAQMETRSVNAAYLDELLTPFGFVAPLPADACVTRNAYHLYFVRVLEDRLGGVSRDSFLRAVAAEGVPISSGYRPLYTFPGVNEPHDCPVADRIAAHEASWITQNALLSARGDMRDIAQAMEKVYACLDELREGK
ncbi:MAG: DegT/DnrJ/EryC1/StrS family aminotransferase [Clostridiaceae bacterium]|nr:DegT/DnrJ/EryC1/StrS family aminotransferase [Clostridiaceae bacterium]